MSRELFRTYLDEADRRAEEWRAYSSASTFSASSLLLSALDRLVSSRR
jgi:hypothetical protein